VNLRRTSPGTATDEVQAGHGTDRLTILPEHQQQAERAKRSRREQARTFALVALAVLITVFAVLNLEDVKVNWILGSSRVPVIVAIVVSLVAGVLLCAVAERRRGRRR
jgi:uncharacterized integral membrane protein